MATYNTLTGLLSAIANAIRSKTGETGVINAQNFPSKIEGISTTPKTQKVTNTITLTSGEVKDQTFTFNELTTVYGVSKIERPYNTNQAYSSHQILDSRYYQDFDPITISGNTVTLKIGNRTDTTSVATWSVTAIGD